MHFSKKILFLLVIFSITNFCVAQEPGKKNVENYRAIHWDISDGLSQGVVTSMLKDVNGFLWIATEAGLNRFDGSTFKNYFPNKSKSGTIINSKLHGLIEDSLHYIWIGTDKGLSRYDIKADTFTNFPSRIEGKITVPFWATKDEVFFWDYPESQLAAYNIH